MKLKERYKDDLFPFKVDVDPAVPQMSATKFFIEVISETEFKITSEPTDGFPLFTKGASLDDNVIRTVKLAEKFEFEAQGTFGQVIENEYFKFTINRTPNGRVEDGAVYGFSYIPNPFWANYYQGAVDISKIGRSVV